MTLTFHFEEVVVIIVQNGQKYHIFVESISFFIYFYNNKWMNKTYNQSETILADIQFRVIIQLSFQKVIHKRRQIH